MRDHERNWMAVGGVIAVAVAGYVATRRRLQSRYCEHLYYVDVECNRMHHHAQEGDIITWKPWDQEIDFTIRCNAVTGPFTATPIVYHKNDGQVTGQIKTGIVNYGEIKTFEYTITCVKQGREIKHVFMQHVGKCPGC